MTIYIIQCLQGEEPAVGVACEIEPFEEDLKTGATNDNGLLKEDWDHEPSRNWQARMIDPNWIVIGQNPADVPQGTTFYTFNVVLV